MEQVTRRSIVGRLLIGGCAVFFLAIGFLARDESSLLQIPSSTGALLHAGTGSVRALPVRLRIPRIAVDARVEHVGLAQDGTMGIPSGAMDIGWYKPGIVPGQNGNAVMAGHLDSAWGAPAIFWRLSELQKGDDIFVDDASGATLHFRVVRTEVYDAATAPLTDIFGTASVSNLQLVTCNGAWIQSKRTYSKRLVVFTTLVDDVEA